MKKRLLQFFTDHGLSEEFLREIEEALTFLDGDDALLQEHIYMLCHQYEYAHPEKILYLLLKRSIITEIIEDYSPRTEPTRFLGEFSDVALLGVGGMGEVRRVWDQDLQCHLAMKILHEHLCSSNSNVDRFNIDGSVDTVQGNHIENIF